MLDAIQSRWAFLSSYPGVLSGLPTMLEAIRIQPASAGRNCSADRRRDRLPNYLPVIPLIERAAAAFGPKIPTAWTAL